jgi:predicted phage-related endonuclease
VKRPRGLGGGDATSIVGFNQYASPYLCYLQKLGIVEKEPAGEAALLGNWLEPRILQRHAVEQGVAVVAVDPTGDLPPWEADRIVYLPDGSVHTVLDADGKVPLGSAQRFQDAALLLNLHHAEHPLLTYLDGVACNPDDGTPLYIVDVKTVGPRKAHEWGAPYTDQLPKSHTIQFQHYDTNLRSHGVVLPWRVLTLFRGPATTVDYLFDPSERLADRLLRAELAFWERLMRHDPPPLDESEATYRALNRIWREERGKVLISEPGDPLEQLARAFKAAHLLVKEGERRKRMAAGGLKLVMREAAKVQGAGWSFTWTTPETKPKVDHEAALAEFRNEIAMQFSPSTQMAEKILGSLDGALAAHTTTKRQARRLHPSVGKLDALPPPKEENDERQLTTARTAGPTVRQVEGGDHAGDAGVDGRAAEVPDA